MKSLPSSSQRCPVCQLEVDPSSRFCGRCGHPLPAFDRAAPPMPPSSRPDAITPTAANFPPSRPTRLVPIRQDGRAGTVWPIGPTPIVCGRERGHLRFEGDPTVSPEHARFIQRGDTVHVEDLASLNGTYLRLRAPRPLAPGDEIRLGRQLLRAEAMPRPAEGNGTRPWGSANTGYYARLVQLLEGGGVGEVFPLVAGENAVGRETARVCFPTDRFVSAKHARIDVTSSGLVLSDLGSSNGTFIRLTAPEALRPGDQVLIGQQLVRVD